MIWANATEYRGRGRQREGRDEDKLHCFVCVVFSLATIKDTAITGQLSTLKSVGEDADLLVVELGTEIHRRAEGSGQFIA